VRELLIARFRKINVLPVYAGQAGSDGLAEIF
jgi:hypothetical protein